MNSRIMELYKEATGESFVSEFDTSFIRAEKFAELIEQECIDNFAKVWYEQGLDLRGAELDRFMKRFLELNK